MLFRSVLAMGDHMPVHLGSMPMSVRAAIAELPLAPGDVAMLNDPFRGGTHLPDITVVAPACSRDTDAYPFVPEGGHSRGAPVCALPMVSRGWTRWPR